MWPPKRILHPTDFSKHASYAFDLAEGLARQTGAELFLLHVMPTPMAVYGDAMVEPASAVDKEAIVKQLHELKPKAPGVTIHYLTAEGDAAPTIVAAAKERQADLIVVGSHGRRGLRRILLGSVAEQVLRSSPCPVLTTTMPVTEGETEAS
ncbi:MAG TPA: universal stress protein [Gemmatales bacterium]|nr:universal stress protein [Gemmatales bacterium]HMP58900.1 universal stress protein [Gemmatales bacterium]